MNVNMDVVDEVAADEASDELLIRPGPLGRLWLIKVPASLSDKWENARDMDVLGEIRVYEAASEMSSKIALIPFFCENENPDQPRWNFEPATNPPPMAVLTESTHGGSVAVDGMIDLKADLTTPRQDNSYRLRGRGLVIPPRREVKHLSESRTLGSAPLPIVHEPRPTEPKLKNERLDRETLIDMLFSCFERQPNWTLSELHKYTQQPLQWLKEVVGEICEINRKGPNKSTFSLKGGYHRAPEPEAPPPPGKK